MILKILKTDGEKTLKKFGSLQGYLFPESAKRVAIAYFPFLVTLNGEKRRGIQLLEQKVSVEKISEIDLTTQYNRWNNTRFLDYYFQK